MTMQDSRFLKYLEYFGRLPSARVYYWIVGRQEKGVTAKWLAKEMDRSIQTTTNALRSLEREGLLESKKAGRERIYKLKDPDLYESLMRQSMLRIQSSGKRIPEDQMSTGIFKDNIGRWLSYLADMMEGTLYSDLRFKSPVIDTTADYIIENKFGQYLILIFHIKNLKDHEAAIGRIFSLATPRSIIPNLHTVFIVGFVSNYEIIKLVRNGFWRLLDHLEKAQLLISSNVIIEKENAVDLIEPEFAKKIGSKIAELMTFHSEEALPGEDWVSDISERRERAMKYLQGRINPKAGERWIVKDILAPTPYMRKLLSRDEELEKLLNPESFLAIHGLKKAGAFLDVACFDGLFTRAATRIVGREGKIYAIDPSPTAVQNVRVFADEKGIGNLVVKEGLAEKVMLGEEIADIAFFGTVVPSLYNPVKAFHNAHRMLRAGGKLVVLEWKQGDLDAGPTVYKKLGREKVKAYIEAAGFAVEATEDEGDYFYTIIAIKK
ncbi:MAG: methyltransferase domain-containing protein [Candidatus Bathyarchaeum sp.]|nr:MAG: methyltransferase domain-containing protein [Candidatus Bathyarchaeum sp.]